MFAKDAPIDSELESCKVMKKLDEMEIAWTETQKESMKTKLKERIKKAGGREISSTTWWINVRDMGAQLQK